MRMGMGRPTGTSPACQEVTGTGPRPYPCVQVQTFVSGYWISMGTGKGTTSLLS